MDYKPIIQIINEELADSGIIPRQFSIDPYEFEGITIELEDCYYYYIVKISYLTVTSLHEAIQLIKRCNIIYGLNLEIDSINQRNDLLIGLYKLTKQHKDIYESGTEIYDSFVEQAGTYESVVKSYNYYETQYKEKVLNPILDIQKKIDELLKISFVRVDSFGIKTELEMSVFNKPTITVRI